MKTLTLFRALGLVDLKNVARDSMLPWIPFIPLVQALVIRLAVPPLATLVDERFALNLVPYYPLIVSFFLLESPAVVGMVVGFLLLDEREERTLSALLVTPVSMGSYLFYRISIPLLLSVCATLIGYPLIGLTQVGLIDLLIVALMGACVGPMTALALATFAENKVAGFSLLKLFNALLLVPLLGFFLPYPWQLLAGVVPTYWPLRIFWLAAHGESYWLFLLGGIVVNGLVLGLLLRRLAQVIHR